MIIDFIINLPWNIIYFSAIIFIPEKSWDKWLFDLRKIENYELAAKTIRGRLINRRWPLSWLK